MKETAQTPTHVGFIVDGNRRWAEERGLASYEGHVASREYFYDVMLAVFDHGVQYVSVYLFSTENWKRSETEVKKLMDLFMVAVVEDIQKLIDHKIRLKIIGSQKDLKPDMRQAISEAEAQTNLPDACQELILCWNYGGQQEIADACASMMRAEVSPDQVTPEIIANYLYAPEVPPCDLIVRTSGEQRLSNFMLWRSAYSELIFLEKYWPDMRPEDITGILEEYNRRNRRHGG